MSPQIQCGLLDVDMVEERITFEKEMELFTNQESEDSGYSRTAQLGFRSVIFPSGESLRIVDGPVGIEEEHYDINASGNPLLDCRGSNSLKYLSKNFRVGDFARSGKKIFDMARIDPKLVRCVQAIRDGLGVPVFINSGYRSYQYNKEIYSRVGKRPTKSQHMSGRAADIRARGKTGLDIARVAIDTCGCNVALGLGSSFLHIDVRGSFAVWNYAGLDKREGDRQVNVILRYRRSRCIGKPYRSRRPWT